MSYPRHLFFFLGGERILELGCSRCECIWHRKKIVNVSFQTPIIPELSVGLRIHWLCPFAEGWDPQLGMTLNLVWSLDSCCGVHFHYHYSQVHSSPKCCNMISGWPNRQSDILCTGPTCENKRNQSGVERKSRVLWIDICRWPRESYCRKFSLSVPDCSGQSSRQIENSDSRRPSGLQARIGWVRLVGREYVRHWR